MNAISIPGLLGGIQLLTKIRSADLAAAKLFITGVMVGAVGIEPTIPITQIDVLQKPHALLVSACDSDT